MTGKDALKKINKITGIVNELAELKTVDSKLITKTIRELNDYQRMLQNALNNIEISVDID